MINDRTFKLPEKDAENRPGVKVPFFNDYNRLNLRVFHFDETLNFAHHGNF